MNDQWSKDVEKAEPGFFTTLAKGQKPQILWIGCSDSRVPESVVCGVPPGEIFVTRNVANQFLPNDDSANSVLAYAVDTVGVQHVIVAGHTNCGGAVASLNIASSLPPSTPTADTALSRWLSPLINLAGSLIKNEKGGKKVDVTTLVEENVKEQVKNIIASPTIRAAWSSGKKVYIHGWVFDIESGKLRCLGVSQGPPA